MLDVHEGLPFPGGKCSIYYLHYVFIQAIEQAVPPKGRQKLEGQSVGRQAADHACKYRQTDRQMDGRTDRLTDRHTYKQTDGQQTDGRTDR